jgi:hypothetical protein
VPSPLPAHYSIDGICAACGGAIRTGDGRYQLGAREYHENCFDISLFGTPAHSEEQLDVDVRRHQPT